MKVSTCLWSGKDVEEAVRFYVSLVPGSEILHVLRSPGPWPGGETGDVILVTFTLNGQNYQALNGGAPAHYGTAASISVECPDQAEGRPAVGGADRERGIGDRVWMAPRSLGRAVADCAPSASAAARRP